MIISYRERKAKKKEAIYIYKLHIYVYSIYRTLYIQYICIRPYVSQFQVSSENTTHTHTPTYLYINIYLPVKSFVHTTYYHYYYYYTILSVVKRKRERERKKASSVESILFQYCNFSNYSPSSLVILSSEIFTRPRV